MHEEAKSDLRTGLTDVSVSVRLNRLEL